MGSSSEAARLEALWAGRFSDEYSERNAAAGKGRRPFWAERVERLGFASALEVGCTIGANLRWLAELLGTEHVAGVDVNAHALELVEEGFLSRADGVWGDLTYWVFERR